MHCWYLELIQLGLTGHEHQHGLPHLPNEIVPFEKASTNVYIPSCSAVDFNYGYKGEGGGVNREHDGGGLLWFLSARTLGATKEAKWETECLFIHFSEELCDQRRR